MKANERDRNGAVDPTGMGTFIAIGAGMGLIFGTMLDNLAMGLAAGAGFGTVLGAIVETGRRQKKGKSGRVDERTE